MTDSKSNVAASRIKHVPMPPHSPKTTIQLSQEHNLESYVVFVDLVKAFTSLTSD